MQFWPENLGVMLEYWYVERGLLLFSQIEKVTLTEFLFHGKLKLENPGIDTGTSRMQSGRSTIWANSPQRTFHGKLVSLIEIDTVIE